MAENPSLYPQTPQYHIQKKERNYEPNLARAYVCKRRGVMNSGAGNRTTASSHFDAFAPSCAFICLLADTFRTILVYEHRRMLGGYHPRLPQRYVKQLFDGTRVAVSTLSLRGRYGAAVRGRHGWYSVKLVNLWAVSHSVRGGRDAGAFPHAPCWGLRSAGPARSAIKEAPLRHIAALYNSAVYDVRVEFHTHRVTMGRADELRLLLQVDRPDNAVSNQSPL